MEHPEEEEFVDPSEFENFDDVDSTTIENEGAPE